MSSSLVALEFTKKCIRFNNKFVKTLTIKIANNSIQTAALCCTELKPDFNHRLLPAGLHALRRALGAANRPSDQQLMGTVTVTLQDLQWAMSVVKPSAMREVAIDVPKVRSPRHDP